MGAITIPAAVFDKAHDEHAHFTDLLDEQDWEPSTPYLVTDEEVEQHIADVAAFGVYEDELGATKHASPLCHAVARQWVQDKDLVGEIIGNAFWREMRAACRLAKHGK